MRNATAGDWTIIENLLTRSSLPLAGAREHLGGFVVAEVGGVIVGCAALERYGSAALVRSVAVDDSRRSHGTGRRLVQSLIDIAKEDGIETLALLTTTAERWFPRFGFRHADRGDLPAALTQSQEFRGACPASAVAMILDLRA